MTEEAVEPAPKPALSDQESTHMGMVALLLGYNELAKRATVLGEKVYWRMMVNAIEEKLKAEGAKFDMLRDPPMLVLSSHQPVIIFTEKDIEMMRETVRKYDEEKP